MPSATDIQRTARRAGVLYLVLSIVAMFSFFYLRPRFVHLRRRPGRRPVTLSPTSSSTAPAFLLDLFGQLVFIVVVLELTAVQGRGSHSGTSHARARGNGIAVQVATQALNLVPLILLGGADYLSAFTRPQLEALAYGSLRLFGNRGIC